MPCGLERFPDASGRSSGERTAVSDGAHSARNRGRRLHLLLLCVGAQKADNPTPADRSSDSNDKFQDSSDVLMASVLKRCRASVSFLVSRNRWKSKS